MWSFDLFFNSANLIFEVRVSRSILKSPLDFEITRVGCNFATVQEPWSQKIYHRTCAPNEGSYHPAHPRSLIRALLSTQRNFASLAIQNAPSKDSNQTARTRRRIWIFAGRTCLNIRFLTLRLHWTSFAFPSYNDSICFQIWCRLNEFAAVKNP